MVKRKVSTSNHWTYWKYAYEVAGIAEHQPEDDEYKFRHIDDFWQEMEKLKDSKYWRFEVLKNQ